MKVRISGIHIIADNIIIAAQEHDNILQQVLEIGKVHHDKLNFDELQLRVSEVKYLGTIITADGVRPDTDIRCQTNNGHTDSYRHQVPPGNDKFSGKSDSQHINNNNITKRSIISRCALLLELATPRGIPYQNQRSVILCTSD